MQAGAHAIRPAIRSSSMVKESDQFVRSLARGLQVIESFEGGSPAYRLTEIAARAKMSRATVRRILNTLHALGYVATDGQRYSLRPKLLSLGHAYLSSFALPDIMLPYMKQLVGDQLHVSSSSSVLDDSDIVFVAGVPATGLLRVFMSVGLRVPAFASAMGRALLSTLPQSRSEAILRASNVQALTNYTVTNLSEIKKIVATARQRGYALADQELGIGLRSVAVPIFLRDGEAVAAISVTCHDMSVSMKAFLKRCLPSLQQTAAQISQSISNIQIMHDVV
jgi:IclR family pca regulon transcriptional regulator